MTVGHCRVIESTLDKLNFRLLKSRTSGVYPWLDLNSQ